MGRAGALNGRDHPGSGEAMDVRYPGSLEGVLNQLGCSALLIAELGMAVDVPPGLNEIGLGLGRQEL